METKAYGQFEENTADSRTTERAAGKRIAIVTGASSGLGREFIRQMDADNREYDEFWVIARRKERLEELQEGTRTPLRVLPYDLTDKAAIQEIRALLEEEKPDVRLLINAAGFGKIGSYAEIPLEQIDNMIDLNCRAAVDMSQICIPFMQENSHICEICSVAAFQPIQYMNVYAASKSFLYRYSRALRIELLPRKIYVTAVCPYWVKDTEFIPTAADETEGGSKAYFASFPFASTMDIVVSKALLTTKLGLAVCTPNPIAALDRFFGKIFSSDIMMGIIALVRRIPGR